MSVWGNGWVLVGFLFYARQVWAREVGFSVLPLRSEVFFSGAASGGGASECDASDCASSGFVPSAGADCLSAISLFSGLGSQSTPVVFKFESATTVTRGKLSKVDRVHHHLMTTSPALKRLP